MIAIPQEEYIHLTSMQRMKQPEAQKMSELSQQYQQQSRIPDPYEHLVLQGSTLEEMKQLKEKIRQDLSLGTPKPYRNRALSLYHSIEPVINFNERGEMMGEDHQPIAHSRAEDLIQHAVRDRRRAFTPIAWDTFVKLLKHHNIPRHSLNRATLDELEAKPPAPKKPTRTARKPLAFDTPDLKETPLLDKKRKRVPSSRYPSPDFLKDF